MKPTIKVSIGQFAFNLEDDAYQLIDDYLKRLNKHFENNPEGSEIISDVESRMAELLQMRIAGKSGVVSVSDAWDIISIMGNPKDFGDEQEDKTKNVHKENKWNDVPKKRLYRDTEHKVLGGVCSGLGNYFNMDPVVMRILVVLIIVLFSVVVKLNHFSISGFSINATAVLLYIGLWIVMPKAKTLTQKIAMTGRDPSIENIESRDQSPLIRRERRESSSIWKAIKISFRIVLGIISLAIVLSLIAVIAMFFGFWFTGDYPTVSDILNMISLNSLDVKLAALIVIALPLIGLGYLCLKLLFLSHFSVRNVVASLIGVALWIGACCYVGGISLNFANKHKEQATETETVNLETDSDVLYIKSSDDYAGSKPLLDIRNVDYLKERNRSFIFFIPHICIREDSTLSAFKIKIRKTASDETKKAARKKASNFHPDYEINDSLLVIKPQLFNKDHPWDGIHYNFTIIVPPNKKVVFEESLNENYSFETDYE